MGRLGFEEALREIESILRGSRLVGVATHSNADPDAVASLILAARISAHYGARVCFMVPEGLSKLSKRLLSSLDVELAEACSEDVKLDACIVVDASNPAQLGDFREACLAAGKLIVIDHHHPGELSSRAHAAVVAEDSPSTTEVLVETCIRLGVPLDRVLAELAMAGLVYDSRRFMLVGENTFRVAEHLLKAGCDYRKVLDLLRVEKEWPEELSERVAILRALSRLRLAKACSDLLVAVTHIGSHESLVARTLLELGADVVVVVADRGDTKRVSVRVSKRALSRAVEAQALASYIASRLSGEGGGHREAAMAHLRRSENAESVAEEIARTLPGRVGRVCAESERDGEESQSLR